MLNENLLVAFSLTLFAGLAAGIGGFIALFAKQTNTKFLSISLGFSAGVMIYISFVEILGKGFDLLTNAMGEKTGSWITVLAFFGGMALIAIIDRFIPKAENPHEISTKEELAGISSKTPNNKVKNPRLLRMGLFTALAIMIHNFPEGMVTFMIALKDPVIAIPIAVAIALHNIPEGIAVYVPIYYATGNKRKAFMYSLLSGLSEPVGAVIGFLVLYPFLTDSLFGIIFAGVAGIMVFISLDELLPASREYGESHHSIYGLVAGMAVMAVSLLLFI